MADFGYDVSDYCDVDPLFGTLDDFDAPPGRRPRARPQGRARLGAQPHVRPAPVVRQASRSSRDDPKRDWYVWRDPAPDGGPPNNWIGVVRATGRRGPSTRRPASTTCTASCPSSPTSTGPTPRSSRRMHDTLRFWLDRGVDGFRIDVVHLIGKDPELPDDPTELAGLPHVRAQRSARDPRAAARHPRAARRVPRRPHDGRRGVPARHRRSSPPTTATATSCTSLQLPAAATRRGRPTRWRTADRDHAEPSSTRSTPGRPGCCRTTTSRATAPATAARGPGPRRRGAAADAARHAVPLRRRGARPRGRRRPARPGGRPRRPRRLSGPDPVGRRRPSHGWATADPWLPWPPEAEHPQRRAASAPTRRRSCTSTGGCSPAARARRRCSSDDARAARRRPGDGVVGWTRTRGDDASHRARQLHRRAGDASRRRRPACVEVASDGVGEGAAVRRRRSAPTRPS